MQSQKITKLTDSAFRLWVRGLCYCQTALTDGLIPVEALRDMGAKRKDVELLNTVLVEGRAPLWETHPVGYKVHDYLDWNDCRDKVVDRLTEAKKRKDEWTARQRAERAEKRANGTRSERVGNAVPNTIAVAPNQTKPNQTSTKQEHEKREPPPSARSHRPIFPGQRVKVFEWLFDDLCGLLGPHVNDFDLHGWFDALDHRCLADGTIPPARDNGAWLKQECLLEAQRRGLPLKVATVESEDDVWAAIAKKGPSVRP